VEIGAAFSAGLGAVAFEFVPLERIGLTPYNHWDCEVPRRLRLRNSKLSAPDSIMAKGGKRKKKVETVFLVCEETGDHNYTIRRKTGGEKLKLSKYSPRLRKHTMHTEKKK